MISSENKRVNPLQARAKNDMQTCTYSYHHTVSVYKISSENKRVYTLHAIAKNGMRERPVLIPITIQSLSI